MTNNLGSQELRRRLNRTETQTRGQCDYTDCGNEAPDLSDEDRQGGTYAICDQCLPRWRRGERP